ncbi:MAG: ADP-ribosylglycohydrolase family protein [Rhodothermaceae bacterium]|nr:ADP-ribosylglycohydrolase family protein [Rhodothermaceae bacterium]
MPLLSRRTFTKSGLASFIALLTPFSLESCDVLRSRKSVPSEAYLNKLKGMILLGAYGDALGAFHEPRGLQGYTGNPDSIHSLPKAVTYQPPGSQATPWWVWIRGDELTEDIVGVPTDDSAFRLLILHPWLISLDKKQPTESLFAEWMQDRVRKDRSFEVSQWQRRRQLQIHDWLIMLKDANRWRDDPSPDPTFFIPTEGNPFFRPATPIVFGMFMYLELAALYGGYPPHEVMHHFSTFSQLDQGYAGSVTGLFAGLIAAAIPVSNTRISFDTWYHSTTSTLLKERPSHAELLNEAFQKAWRIGMENQSKPEGDYLEITKKEIYDAPLPSNRDSIGFRVFDPILFFKQITASIAYSGSDIQKALRLLASSPGDADTLPSMLGTLAGAWAGHASLQQLSNALKDDLEEVDKTLTTLFDYKVHDTSLQLANLAKRMQYS